MATRSKTKEKIIVKNKYFLTLWGGLGDFLKMYYSHAQWRKLEALKQKYPHIKTKAIVYSLSPTSKDLIKNHPYIDEIFEPQEGIIEVRTKGLGAYKQDYHWLQEDRVIHTLKNTHPIVYMTEAEREQVNEITENSKSRYITIHPFSAMNPNVATSRTTMSQERYLPIIEGLAKKGFKLVLLGKSRNNSKEEFLFNHPSIINLIDRTTVPVALNLVKHANGFIGTNSSMMCMALLENKRCYIITSFHWDPKAFSHALMGPPLKQGKSKIVFLPRDREMAPYEKIQRKIVEWFD